jgi:hypothetical protein
MAGGAGASRGGAERSSRAQAGLLWRLPAPHAPMLDKDPIRRAAQVCDV